MPAETTTAERRAPIADLVHARGRRRPGLIAAGLLLASVGAMTVIWLVGAAGQRQEVVVVRHAVEYGQVVDAADLGVVRVSVDPGVSVVPASQRASVEGQVATTRLRPGTLLAEGMVEPAGEPGPGNVLVPVALPSERMPAGSLRPGDRLLVVEAQQVDTAGPVSSGTRAIPATVVRVGSMDVNGITVVDVTTSEADGPALARAAANGQVAVVVQPAVR